MSSFDRLDPPTYPHAQYDRHGRLVYRSRKNRAARAVGRGGWRTVKGAHRHRSYLWPAFTALGMAAAAAGLGSAEDGWKTALVLAVLVGVAMAWKQVRGGTRWAVRAVVIGWATWALCTTWTAVAAAVGALTVPLPGILGLGGIIAQVWWAIHRHVKDKPAKLEALDEEIAEAVLDRRVERWMDTISCDGGALPGSYLVGVDDLEEEGLGWSADIQLPEADAQNSGTAVSAKRRIAKVFKVPPHQVVVEPPIDGLEDTARLLVLNRNPLVKIQQFKGPSLDRETGYIRIGVHADGTYALWRLYEPGSGACHGLVAGTTGAGKGGLVSVLCAEIRHSGNSVLLLGDPQQGESAPDWVDGAHCFAGTVPRIRRMLQGVEREMIAREKRRSRARWVDDKGRTRRGQGKFDPSPDEPLLTVVIDEAWQVTTDPECARIIALIGKQGRKLGVGIVLVVQVPSLAELGGDLTIRSMLSSVNIVMFRTSDKLSGQMGVPMDLPVDPVNLPVKFPDGSSTAGLGYLCQAGGRVAEMRGMFTEDPYHWATTGEPARMPERSIASFADGEGNYWLDWERLLDVDDVEADSARAQVADSYAAPVTGETRARIVAFLEGRGGPVRLGVIADKLNLSKTGTSNALKKLAAERLVHQPENKHGMWAAGMAREDEMAGAR